MAGVILFVFLYVLIPRFVYEIVIRTGGSRLTGWVMAILAIAIVVFSLVLFERIKHRKQRKLTN